MNTNLISLLQDLINFKTVSPHGHDAIKYIASYLAELGFICDIQKFGSSAENETTNLYATSGIDASATNICFAGHVDVVPEMDATSWKFPPFTATQHEGLIYGRGAVDMKGGLACMLAAVKNFLAEHKSNFKANISFLITSDEEGDAEFGTCKMLEYIKDKYPKIDLCILGEPTNKKKIGDTVKIGRRGSINFDLKVQGKQGHVAYPQDALNPIPTAIIISDRLVNLKLDEGSQFFMPSNLKITSIDAGNDITNIIPESVNIKFNIRFNDHYTTDKIVSLIETNIQKITTQTGCKYELCYRPSSESFIQKISPQMENFINVIHNITSIKPNITTDGGTSDARFIYKYANVIEFGLKSDLAHQIDESVQISDLQILYTVYYSFLKSLL